MAEIENILAEIKKDFSSTYAKFTYKHNSIHKDTESKLNTKDKIESQGLNTYYYLLQLTRLIGGLLQTLFNQISYHEKILSLFRNLNKVPEQFSKCSNSASFSKI